MTELTVCCSWGEDIKSTASSPWNSWFLHSGESKMPCQWGHSKKPWRGSCGEKATCQPGFKAGISLGTTAEPQVWTLLTSSYMSRVCGLESVAPPAGPRAGDILQELTAGSTHRCQAEHQGVMLQTPAQPLLGLWPQREKRGIWNKNPVSKPSSAVALFSWEVSRLPWAPSIKWA